MNNKLKTLSIVFLMIVPLAKVNVNRQPSIVYSESIDSSLRKQKKYSDLYSELITSVVTVNNYKTVGLVTAEQSFGSGFIYDEDEIYFYIITNAHVVKNASSLGVCFYNYQEITGTLVGKDTNQDVTVIKVKKSQVTGNVTIAKLHKVNDEFVLPEVGEEVMAIGTPVSSLNRGTCTVGVVSGIKRVVLQKNDDIYKQDHAIQLDLAINPGNSGGPLFNMDGEVVGVNSLKISSDTSTLKEEGLNFALQLHDMYYYATLIRERCSKLQASYSTRYTLGSDNFFYVSIKDLNIRSRRHYECENLNRGVLILNENIEGINARSIIVSFDGKPVDDVVDLRWYLTEKTSEDEVELGLYKFENNKLDDKVTTAKVKLVAVSLKEA